MPEMDGIKATERIGKMGAKARIVMLSMYGSIDLVEQAIKKGASGYLLKRSTTTELLEAVHAVCKGQIFLSPALSRDFDGERSRI